MSGGILRRVAVRVALVDRVPAVLLLRGSDPARPEAGGWWHVPGGGVEDGEALEAAARREVREETGLVLADPGPVVWRRVTRYSLAGVAVAQRESFFVVDVTRFTPETSGWTPLERTWMSGWRWWAFDELAATEETFYPDDLVDRLRRWRASSHPTGDISG